MGRNVLHRWLSAGALGAGLLVCAPAAEAHGEAVVLIVVVPFLGNGIFNVYDLAAVGEEHAPTGWLVAQTVWTAPQTALVTAVPFFDEIPVGISIWIDELSAFSIYGLAAPSHYVPSVYALSWAIGANTALTTNGLGLALKSEFAQPVVAITELVASVPQIALASYALASPGAFANDRPAVLALGGWSAAVFAHGVTSLFFYRPKTPKAAPPKKTLFELAPSFVASDLGLAPGLSLRGTF